MFKKIPVTLLRKGMFVCDTDRKWIDLPFIRQKFLVTSPKEIQTFQEYCQNVYIDTSKGLDVVVEIEDSPVPQTVSFAEPPVVSDANLKLYMDAQALLSEIFQQVRLQQNFETFPLKQLVHQLNTAVLKDSQAMIALTRSSGSSDELARKSVNVCLLSLVFGKFLALQPADQFALGLGSLLHDIGIALIPADILDKQAPLTEDERTAMELHTLYGFRLLSKISDIPKSVLKIVYCHHERMDGSGYPQKLSESKIDQLVRVVSITSVYEALTRERQYRATLSPDSAIRYIYSSGRRMFDAELVEQFIQALGIYPEDCVVELDTGELGIVSRSNPDHRLQPSLRMITNPKKKLLASEYGLDLAEDPDKHRIIRTLSIDDPIMDFLLMFQHQVVMDEAGKDDGSGADEK